MQKLAQQSQTPTNNKEFRTHRADQFGFQCYFALLFSVLIKQMTKTDLNDNPHFVIKHELSLPKATFEPLELNHS
ncbi:MAG: hypothetical protein ACI88A_002683 [Paraglaciecola sp.]|jgi:hypothetical protein